MVFNESLVAYMSVPQEDGASTSTSQRVHPSGRPEKIASQTVNTCAIATGVIAFILVLIAAIGSVTTLSARREQTLAESINSKSPQADHYIANASSYVDLNQVQGSNASSNVDDLITETNIVDSNLTDVETVDNKTMINHNEEQVVNPNESYNLTNGGVITVLSGDSDLSDNAKSAENTNKDENAEEKPEEILKVPNTTIPPDAGKDIPGIEIKQNQSSPSIDVITPTTVIATPIPKLEFSKDVDDINSVIEDVYGHNKPKPTKPHTHDTLSWPSYGVSDSAVTDTVMLCIAVALTIAVIISCIACIIKKRINRRKRRINLQTVITDLQSRDKVVLLNSDDSDS